MYLKKCNSPCNISFMPKPKSVIGTLSFLIFFQNYVTAYNLHLKNDGPAIVYSNLSIEAILDGGIDNDQYSFVLEEGDHEIQKLEWLKNENATFVINMNPDNYSPGTYDWSVKVYKKGSGFFYKRELLAEAKTKFTLTSTINGNISVSNMVGRYLAVNSTVNFTFDIHDPGGYFTNAELDYAWTIGDLSFFNESVAYNVSKEGTVSSHVTIHARVPVSETRHRDAWGFHSRKIEALRRVQNINVTGNVYLPKGDVVSIDIFCNGTGPFRYCWRIYPPDVPSTVIKNMSCDLPVIYSQCAFHFQHYFPVAGKYSIGTIIGNQMGLTQRTIELEIYDVSTRPQLSTIIVPICCSLIGMLIIVIGMTYHIHQRKSYVVEVADFDFQQPLKLSEKTFMERVTESFKGAVHNCKKEPLNMLDDAECSDTESNANPERRGSGESGRSNLLPGYYGSTA